MLCNHHGSRVPPFPAKNRLVYVLLYVMVCCLRHSNSLFSYRNSRMALVSFRSSSQSTADAVVGQPFYEMAGENLSQQWIDMVRNEKVVAAVQVEDDGKIIPVNYGVRLTKMKSSQQRCEEFVEIVQDGGESGVSSSPLVQTINETLTELQKQDSLDTSSSVRFVQDEHFVAQLQLVRTLRPPASPGFAKSTTSTPPPYDDSSDSFVTGPLRLQLRPLVATLNLPVLCTPWDVYHNMSPADTRGHFLLIPTLGDRAKNWRGQSLSEADCHDLMQLTKTIRPSGSLFVGFNSVGAGASQNHVHCHAWPSPPMCGEASGESKCYAVARVESIHDYCDVGNVEVSWLEYPVFCVQISSHDPVALGQVLATVLKMAGDAPHNIGCLNRMEDTVDNKETVVVDVFVFVRSRERSEVLPGLKLGVSEMMGVFHAQSEEELVDLGASHAMERALKDVSYVEEVSLWDRIKSAL